ncbi:MAG: hypothetical protein WC356_01870 [Candidatus Micrarchaeia archaeon]|jgi:hypothetical protein
MKNQLLKIAEEIEKLRIKLLICQNAGWRLADELANYRQDTPTEILMDYRNAAEEEELQREEKKLNKAPLSITKKLISIALSDKIAQADNNYNLKS